MAKLGMFSFIAAGRYRKTHAKTLVDAARAMGECMQTEPALQTLAKSVPANVYLHWARAHKNDTVQATHSEYWIFSSLSLLAYFRMVAIDAGRAKHGLALPSNAAIAVWRAWEQNEPESLTSFLQDTLGSCAQYVGRCPKDAEDCSPRAMADAWALGHLVERIDVRTRPNLEVPFIFSVDKALKLPGSIAFFRDPFEPLGGFYRPMDGRGNMAKEVYGSDILSELFLYDMPEAETPAQAWAEIQKKRPLISRALSALHAALGGGGKPARAIKVNPTKTRKSTGRSSDNVSGVSRTDDSTTSSIVPLIVMGAILGDSSSASSSYSSDSSPSSGGSSCSSSSGSSCSSSSGSSCSSSSGSSCGSF